MPGEQDSLSLIHSCAQTRLALSQGTVPREADLARIVWNLEEAKISPGRCFLHVIGLEFGPSLT